MLKQIEEAVFIERQKCINCGSANLVELSRGRYSDQPLARFLAEHKWAEDPLSHLQSATWLLVRCSECSQVFHRKILNDQWSERCLTKWINTRATNGMGDPSSSDFQTRFSQAKFVIEHILRIEKLTRDIRGGSDAVRLLDFGCGFDHFFEACEHFGFDVVGIDRSIGRNTPACPNLHSSLSEISKSAKFHAITLFETLQTLEKPSDTLGELSAYLVPGGILVLETPDCAGVSEIKTEQDYRVIKPLTHINAFTHQTLKSIAERNGFRLIPRGAAFVASELDRVLKRAVRHTLRREGASTHLYFRFGS
jgi:2-polyprenyl-3-methyl-5-hydroxy-6-metoxy-1,4-benzoquinol methylase